jgi:hypothetical protein
VRLAQPDRCRQRKLVSVDRESRRSVKALRRNRFRRGHDRKRNRDSRQKGIRPRGPRGLDDNGAMPAKPPRELVEFLSRYDKAVSSLALALRTIIRDELSPCHEYIFNMRSRLVLLYSTSEKPIADGICHCAVNARHITLGFVQGVDMADPSHALRGAGKTMRHVRIEGAADLDRSELRALLREARKLSGMKPRKAGEAPKMTIRIKTRMGREPTTPKAASGAWPKRLF